MLGVFSGFFSSINGFFGSVCFSVDGFFGGIGVGFSGVFCRFGSIFLSVGRCSVFSSVSGVFVCIFLCFYSFFSGISIGFDRIASGFGLIVGRRGNGFRNRFSGRCRLAFNDNASFASGRLNSRDVSGTVLVFVDNLHCGDTCEQDNGGEYNGFNDVVH